MNVWIITMAFPASSETFASNEVLALCRAGAEVSVHNLRPCRADTADLVVERKLTNLTITHNSWQATLEGLRIGFSQPRLCAALFKWVVSHTWQRPNHLIRSLILLPRSLEMYDKIKQASPDVVHLYWSHYPSLVGYLVQEKLPDILVSISFVAHDVNEQYACTDLVARRADFVHTITTTNIPAIARLGIARDRISVFYHGVNFQQIPASTPKIPFKIVTAGRLIPEKGFEDTLQVFYRVKQRWQNASLVILGRGSHQENLERLARSLGIADAVEFRGHISHDLVFAEMASAEVFLFLSKFSAERLPNVVKEAMVCRCLSVVTHTPGIEELICSGKQGYVVEPGDIESAAELLNKAFANPTEKAAIIANAYHHVTTNFDLDQIIQNLYQKWQKNL